MVIEKKRWNFEKVKNCLNNEDYPFMELLQVVLQYFRMTQEELAELLGVDRSTISLWSRGKTEPSILVQHVVRARLGKLIWANISGIQLEILKS